MPFSGVSTNGSRLAPHQTRQEAIRPRLPLLTRRALRNAQGAGSHGYEVTGAVVARVDRRHRVRVGSQELLRLPLGRHDGCDLADGAAELKAAVNWALKQVHDPEGRRPRASFANF